MTDPPKPSPAQKLHPFLVKQTIKKTIASGKCKRTTAQSQNLIRNLQLCSKTRVNKSTTPSKGHATQPRNLWIKFTELPKTQSLDKLKKNVRSSSSSTIYDIQMKNQSPVVLSTHLNGQPLLLLPIVLWLVREKCTITATWMKIIIFQSFYKQSMNIRHLLRIIIRLNLVCRIFKHWQSCHACKYFRNSGPNSPGMSIIGGLQAQI